ncbi:hypothetical protein L2E82_06903 [Cichorium intybus]|uniref:Uncharacterized protein n=1 Tax=Cichorium intybus TaxID=13427 RepID=A0ACB9G3I2_CICIN|nr:hypothetical protein L2E82_06903 [Cichorium intybus]
MGALRLGAPRQGFGRTAPVACTGLLSRRDLCTSLSNPSRKTSRTWLEIKFTNLNYLETSIPIYDFDFPASSLMISAEFAHKILPVAAQNGQPKEESQLFYLYFQSLQIWSLSSIS